MSVSSPDLDVFSIKLAPLVASRTARTGLCVLIQEVQKFPPGAFRSKFRSGNTKRVAEKPSEPSGADGCPPGENQPKSCRLCAKIYKRDVLEVLIHDQQF